MSAAPKALFILTSNDRLGSSPVPGGFYLSECAHPHTHMREAGWTVDFATPKGGQAPVDKMSLTELLKDAASREFYESGEVKARLASTLSIARTDFDQYACVFIVGGHAPMWDLPENRVLVDKLAQYYKRGGIIGAVCHGVCALVNVCVDGRMLLAGREVTAFSNAEEERMKMTNVVPFLLESKLKSRGAIFKCAEEPFKPCVAVSDRLFTGQNPASATPLAEAIVRAVRERAESAPQHPRVAGMDRIAAGPKLQPHIQRRPAETANVATSSTSDVAAGATTQTHVLNG